MKIIKYENSQYLSENFYKQFIKEVTGKEPNKNYSYAKSHKDVLEYMLGNFLSGKRSLIKVMDAWDKFPEFEEFKDIVIKNFINHIQKIEDKTNPEIYISYRYKGIDWTNTIRYCMELSKKDKRFEFINQLKPEDFKKILKIDEEKSNLSLELLENYSYFVNNKLMESIDLSQKLNLDYQSQSKASLKQLITAFELQPHARFTNKFISLYKIVYTQDPDLSGINLDQFINTVKVSSIDEENKNKFLNFFSEKENESVFEMQENIFHIKLNVEKIILFRKKQLKDNYGENFIIRLQDTLSKAKKNGIELYQCFEDNGLDFNKAQHHTTASFTSKTKAYMLKDLSFTYTNDEDKTRKQEVFKTLINSLLKLDYTDNWLNYLEKTDLQYKLNNELSNNEKPKKIKNKI